MELKSDPVIYETVTVTDIDIAFPGDHQSFTLLPADTLTMDETDNTLTLTFGHGGVMVFNLKHAHFFAKKQRQMRVITTETTKPTETKDKE